MGENNNGSQSSFSEFIEKFRVHLLVLCIGIVLALIIHGSVRIEGLYEEDTEKALEKEERKTMNQAQKLEKDLQTLEKDIHEVEEKEVNLKKEVEKELVSNKKWGTLNDGVRIGEKIRHRDKGDFVYDIVVKDEFYMINVPFPKKKDNINPYKRAANELTRILRFYKNNTMKERKYSQLLPIVEEMKATLKKLIMVYKKIEKKQNSDSENFKQSNISNYASFLVYDLKNYSQNPTRDRLE